MGLGFRFGLIVLFVSGVYAVDLYNPQALQRPESVIGLAIVGGVFLAILLDALRFRSEDRRGRKDARSAEAFSAPPAQREQRPLELVADKSRAGSESSPMMRRSLIALRTLTVNLALWCALVFGFAIAYANRAEIKETALVTLSALKPGEPIALSRVETVLTRDGYGHFTTEVWINGRSVQMLVDTGSSDVALPYEEALRLGVDIDSLNFDRAVMTANGEAMVAPIRLPQVTVGPITLHDVAASVAEPGRLGSPLLGMSFLGQLSEVSIRGNKLRLKS